MKNFFKSLDVPSSVAIGLIVIFIGQTITAVFDQKFQFAIDHVLMIVLTLTILYYRRSVINYEKIVKSYENLVEALEDQSSFRAETINMMKKLVEMRNETITQLESKVAANSVGKKVKKAM